MCPYWAWFSLVLFDQCQAKNHRFAHVLPAKTLPFFLQVQIVVAQFLDVALQFLLLDVALQFLLLDAQFFRLLVYQEKLVFL